MATLRIAIAGRPSMMARNMTTIMMADRSVAAEPPEIAKYRIAPRAPPAAAHFLIGCVSASTGMVASAKRRSANTAPAMIAMCKPEIERMWTRPLSR